MHVLVAGHNAQGAAQAAAQLAGVAKVLLADARVPRVSHRRERRGDCADAACRVLHARRSRGATASARTCSPRIAAKLDVAQVSEVTGIESADTFVRPIYAGNAFATVQSKDPVKVLTVRTTAFDARRAAAARRSSRSPRRPTPVCRR